MTRSDITNYLASTNGTVLGAFCGWSLQGGSLPKERVIAILEKHGLVDDFKLQKVGPTQGYRRAVMKSTTGKREDAKYNTVKIREDGDMIMHAIVQQSALAGSASISNEGGELALTGEIDFAIEFRVAFNKVARKNGTLASEMIYIENPEHPVAKKIRSLYDELSVMYTVNDIRAAFQAAFESWHGFSTLAHGGMWFLPSSAWDKAKAWQKALKEMGHQPLLIPIFDSEDSRGELQELAASSVEAAVKMLKQELESFNTKDSKTRMSTIEKRFEKFQDLKAKTALYREVLGLEIEELDKGIDAARAAMEAFMMGLADEGSEE